MGFRRGNVTLDNRAKFLGRRVMISHLLWNFQVRFNLKFPVPLAELLKSCRPRYL